MSSEANAVSSSSDKTIESGQETLGTPIKVDSWYSRYVLGVLVLVYLFNFLDRQILAILAEDIKADLGISDAQIGFLYGTAFAVFYATFGIALGRLADVWNRKKLISLGLGLWSIMTALSGLARGFVPLALCRFGVGIGESSASPAAYSLIYDYFSPKVRTTALGIYGSGLYIGIGLGLFLGGWILDSWNGAWPDHTQAPFGLKGWQAAFMIVGLPGVLLSVWVSTLKEPIKGSGDGIITAAHPHPFREAGAVLLSMVPLANLPMLAKEGGRRAVVTNFAAMLGIFLFFWTLVQLTDNLLQWAALGVGFYAVFSWTQFLAKRDPVVFGMIFKSKTILSMVSAASAAVFMGVALPFWAVPFFRRFHEVSASDVGLVLGVGSAVMGFAGMILGGMIADRLRRKSPRGKLYVWVFGMMTSILSALVFLLAENLNVAYAGMFMVLFCGAFASSPFISTLNDLVLPRGRATTSAFSIMVTTLIGVALGPYAVGVVSDAIALTGVDTGESLRQAMMWSLVVALMGALPVFYVLKHVEEEENNKLDRARALGENI